MTMPRNSSFFPDVALVEFRVVAHHNLVVFGDHVFDVHTEVGSFLRAPATY